jgi:hypothetical protein
LHLNFPFENIDNRMRIMPVDRVDGSWGKEFGEEELVNLSLAIITINGWNRLRTSA